MLKVAKTKQTKRTETGPGTRVRAGAEDEWEVWGGGCDVGVAVLDMAWLGGDYSL